VSLRKPRAFRLDPLQNEAHGVIIQDEPFEAVEEQDQALDEVSAETSWFSWGKVFGFATGLLISLALGLALESLIRELFSTSTWLGWFGLGCAGFALLAFLVFLIREGAGIWRERKIETLKKQAIHVLAMRLEGEAKEVSAQLVALYQNRPEMSQGRARISEHVEDIMEARDRLALAEQALLSQIDKQARRLVASAARQVSLVTALSPRALIDIAFVLFAAVRLLRSLSKLYGGRPGFFSFLRLARAALAHLAVTGGLAAGDSLIQQVLGQGVAAKLSARLGEGVLNGIMTARFGAAAMHVCRPLPFIALDPPKLADLAGDLINRKTS
jgi:putative membrane protein